jgi:hypothetical protein
MLPDNQEGLTSSRLTNVLSTQSQMPLIEYCIKGSYNSAFDGSKVSLDALDNVLKKGCRFLDFEIFFIKGVPSVGVSIDPEFKVLVSKNTLPFKDILKHVISSVFMSSTTPNPKDPLFIQLRIKTNCNTDNPDICGVYSQLATVLAQSQPYIYTENTKSTVAKPVNSGTILSSLMGKIVFCMDVSLSPDYNTFAPNLDNFIHMHTGDSAWTSYFYSDFLTMKTNVLTVDTKQPMTAEPKTGALTLTMARPDPKANVNNPAAPLSWIRNFGCQTILCQFWKTDDGLLQFEKLFDHYKTAFVPIGYAVNYSNNISQ